MVHIYLHDTRHEMHIPFSFAWWIALVLVELLLKLKADELLRVLLLLLFDLLAVAAAVEDEEASAATNKQQHAKISVNNEITNTTTTTKLDQHILVDARSFLAVDAVDSLFLAVADEWRSRLE